MKILYVITGLGVGGAENIAINLADKAKTLGHDVTIVYLTGAVELAPHCKDIPLISLEMTDYKDFFKAINRLRKLIQQLKPDIIHSHMVHANILSRLVRLFVSIPRLVCTAHSTDEGGTARMLAYRLTDRLADITTNVSVEAVQVFESKGAVPKNKMIAVANGIDTTRFVENFSLRQSVRNEFNLGNTFTLAAVGRLEPQKDYLNLLQALRLVLEQGKSAHLLIVGAGSQEQKLKAFVNESNLTAHITWLGIRKDVESVMNAADLFVLSSACEGFGLVVAEAMSCEKVVVATDCGGVREVVGAPELLVPAQDAKLLAKKIIAIMEQPEEERVALGKSLRQRVIDNYSLNSMFENYMKLYLLQ